MDPKKLYVVTGTIDLEKFSDFNEESANIFTNKKDAMQDYQFNEDQYLLEVTVVSVKSDHCEKNDSALKEVFIK